MAKLANNFTVFEAVNEKTREIFIGATRRPVFATIEALRRSPPRCIRHWEFDDVATVRSVEFQLSEADADAFIARRAQGAAAPGYKYFSEKGCEEGV